MPNARRSKCPPNRRYAHPPIGGYERLFLLIRQSDPVQGIDNQVAIGFRQRRHARLHLRQRELRIFLWQRSEAPAGFGFGSGKHIGRTEGSMHPIRRRMPDQPTLLPSGRFGVIAGREMRTADTDHIVECERVLWRQVERYLESFYRRNGVASIRVDPTAAAPSPCRTAVKR